ARVQDSGERRAAPGELEDHRRVDLSDQLVDLGRAEAGNRRERTHAAGVRPGIAVAGALVVAGRGQWNRPPAVAEREHGELLAFEQFLDDDRSADCARGGEAGVELLLRPADED